MMTCIIGLVTGDVVTLASDSAGTNTSSQQVIRADKKLFRVGSFLVAKTISERYESSRIFQEPS